MWTLVHAMLWTRKDRNLHRNRIWHTISKSSLVRLGVLIFLNQKKGNFLKKCRSTKFFWPHFQSKYQKPKYLEDVEASRARKKLSKIYRVGFRCWWTLTAPQLLPLHAKLGERLLFLINNTSKIRRRESIKIKNRWESLVQECQISILIFGEFWESSFWQVKKLIPDLKRFWVCLIGVQQCQV